MEERKSMTLDQMIADAETRFNDAEEGSEEAIAAQHQAEALKAARDAGYTKTQSDLNSAEKQWKDKYRTLEGRVKNTVGDLDEFEKVKKDLIPAAETGQQPEGEDGTPEDLLSQLQAALDERDKRIEEVNNKSLQFEREIRQRDVKDDLTRRFKDLGLQEDYEKAALEFVRPRLESLMDRVMEGEEVSEDLQKLAEQPKELSPIWFEEKRDPNEIVLPEVPRSPNGGQRRELTDEERLKRAEASVV